MIKKAFSMRFFLGLDDPLQELEKMEKKIFQAVEIVDSGCKVR